MCAALEVYFGEVDFREIEGEGAITVSILKDGKLQSDLYLDIIPLTYAQFDERGFPIDPERIADRPEDPAECEFFTSTRNNYLQKTYCS